MLTLRGVTYTHPDGEVLFDNISITIHQHNKIALVGNNGAGKSTLLRLMAGRLQPANGHIIAEAAPYYVPQHFGQYNDITIAQALGVSDKLYALQQILTGNVTEQNMETLADDWTIEERCTEAMRHWQLTDKLMTQRMSELSGGEKTKVFLAGIMIHNPPVVLLDEPSNHLDASGRQLLYQYISNSNQTLLAVSHDRQLLNLPDKVYELDKRGITMYGGNYDFYREQKRIEQAALQGDVKDKEKKLRLAKETEREAMERKHKLDARGKKKQLGSGLPTISMNTLRNNAEKSTAKLKGQHMEKIEGIANELKELRKELPEQDKMRMNFNNATLHKGKTLMWLQNVNFSYDGNPVWQQPLSFSITSGERVAITGNNGAGKTTLIKLLLGKLQPVMGRIQRAPINAVYVDQDYSLADNTLTVYEQAQLYNTDTLQEHEVKIKLSRFLFGKEQWNNKCGTLSGGEKMRLLLCCLTISDTPPDLIVLDEPTNNLDVQNIDILTNAINEYTGTLVVVSHDSYFLEQVGINTIVELTPSSP